MLLQVTPKLEGYDFDKAVAPLLKTVGGFTDTRIQIVKEAWLENSAYLWLGAIQLKKDEQPIPYGMMITVPFVTLGITGLYVLFQTLFSSKELGHEFSKTDIEQLRKDDVETLSQFAKSIGMNYLMTTTNDPMVIADMVKDGWSEFTMLSMLSLADTSVKPESK